MKLRNSLRLAAAVFGVVAAYCGTRSTRQCTSGSTRTAASSTATRRPRASRRSACNRRRAGRSRRGSRHGDQGRRDQEAHAAAHRRRGEGQTRIASTRTWRARSASRRSGASRSLREDTNVYRYNEKGEKVFFEHRRARKRHRPEPEAHARPRLHAGDPALGRQAPCAPACAKRALLLFQVGLVDLDVGLRLQAGEVGIEHLAPELLADAAR